MVVSAIRFSIIISGENLAPELEPEWEPEWELEPELEPEPEPEPVPLRLRFRLRLRLRPGTISTRLWWECGSEEQTHVIVVELV